MPILVALPLPRQLPPQRKSPAARATTKTEPGTAFRYAHSFLWTAAALLPLLSVPAGLYDSFTDFRWHRRRAPVATNLATIDFDGLCPLLQVFDMPTSVKFYREVLGFQLVSNSPVVHNPQGDYFHWCMLRRGGNTLMLNTAYDEGERPLTADPVRVAAHSGTALFFGCPDADATFNQLLPFGVKVLEKPMITGYKMRRFTIADPDGYN